MGIFDDNPPSGFIRSKNSKGWIVPKKTATKKKINAIKEENLQLKERLVQLEEAVSSLLSKKKK